MTSPVVDVIIPVHTDERPIARAVASVFATTRSTVGVTVVCHNIAAAPIAAALGDWAADPRVRLLELQDDLPSPAGPINLGLESTNADFTALLDSDDSYEPGAVDAWLKVQARNDADVVIPTFKYADGSSTRTPPTRPFRVRDLEGVRDRLAYRTRQHGLIRRERFPTLRMAPRLRSGEDVIQGATIWYSNARISFARGTPAYRIHEDGGERTSAAIKPISESLEFLDSVLEGDFIATLSVEQRESFAIKLLRTHIMDVLGLALQTDQPEETLRVAEAVRRIEAIAPQARSIVSRRDAGILKELDSEEPNLAKLSVDLGIRTDFRRPKNILSGSGTQLLHREAPLRFLAATFFAR